MTIDTDVEMEWRQNMSSDEYQAILMPHAPATEEAFYYKQHKHT